MKRKMSFGKNQLLALLMFLFLAAILRGLFLNNYTKYIRENSFPNNLLVREIAFDPQGQMWVSALIKDEEGVPSSSGIFVYKNGKEIKAFTEEKMGVGEFAFGKEGQVWISTVVGDQVAHLNNNQWEYIALLSSSSGTSMDATALAVDSRGQLWVGTLYTGLYIFDGEKWLHDEVRSYSLGACIRDIALDKEDRIWVVKADGSASLFDGEKQITYTSQNSALPSEPIRSVAIDSKNRAWFATENGLYLFDGNIWKKYGNGYFDRVVVDKQDRAWASASLIPVNVMVVVNDKIKYPPLTMAPEAVSPDGWIWTNKGVAISPEIPLHFLPAWTNHWTTTVAFSMMLVVLGFGVFMEMRRGTAFSLMGGILASVATFLALYYIYPKMKEWLSFLTFATITSAGVTIGLFRLKHKDNPTTEKKAQRTILILISLLFSLTIICLCLYAAIIQ